MKKILGLAALKLLIFIPSVCGAVSGKFDLLSLPQPSAYQSFISPQQVVGLEKSLYFVYISSQELCHVGLDVGMLVNDQIPKGAPLGGPTLHVPGSLLDWALGTQMGAAWLPKLKAGVFAGYDLFHPTNIKAKPNFSGFGVTYPVFN